MAPFDLKLPARWKAAKWKVKIRDNEAVEEPHVTILHGPDVWRVSLRDGHIMDGGSWKDIENGVRETIQDPKNWERLRKAWDLRFPHNSVGGNDDD